VSFSILTLYTLICYSSFADYYTRGSNNFQSRYPALNIDPFVSSLSRSSSLLVNSPESLTSPTSQKPLNKCPLTPFCDHHSTGNWSKGNLKRHINEKHAIRFKDESLRCGFEGCSVRFTRPENKMTHLRDIHGVGPAKKTRYKSVKGGVQSQKISSASTVIQSSTEG
jgi:hypothetical protein